MMDWGYSDMITQGPPTVAMLCRECLMKTILWIPKVMIAPSFNNATNNLADKKPKNTNIHKATGRLDPKKQNETNSGPSSHWQHF